MCLTVISIMGINVDIQIARQTLGTGKRINILHFQTPVSSKRGITSYCFAVLWVFPLPLPIVRQTEKPN